MLSKTTTIFSLFTLCKIPKILFCSCN